MRTGTVTELEDWEQGGAVWQPVEITPERAGLTSYSSRRVPGS